jgi:hypothetical protein
LIFIYHASQPVVGGYEMVAGQGFTGNSCQIAVEQNSGIIREYASVIKIFDLGA